MNKANVRYTWEDLPSKNTAIAARKLNEKENTLDIIDDRVVTLDAEKANRTDLLSAVDDVSFDDSTGIFTISYKNGTSKQIPTNINKIAVNFRWDKATEILYVINSDGTETPIDLSSLISTFDFLNSDTLAFEFSLDGKTVSASVIDGSITEEKLQPNFLADCRIERSGAENARDNAEESALTSEGWAVGTQNGVPVGSESPYFENSAKYWAQQAASGTGIKILTFENVSIAESDWHETEEYEDYPYSCDLSLQGVTADFVPYVTFDLESATSGSLAPIAEALQSVVRVYSNEPIEAVIESISCVKGAVQ